MIKSGPAWIWKCYECGETGFAVEEPEIREAAKAHRCGIKDAELCPMCGKLTDYWPCEHCDYP